MSIINILTMPAMTAGEKARRLVGLSIAAVARNLPTRLRYEVLISCGVKAMRNDVVPEVSFMTVLERTPRGWPND